MQYIVHMKDGGKPATICIIDLAGSERAATSSANADPSRLREAIEVNKSLSSLKECIRARLSGDSRVPWRGSKLTMVLRRAFGSDTASVEKPVDSEDSEAAAGNDLHTDTQLVVLACVSPSVFDVDDTIGTLNYISPFQVRRGFTPSSSSLNSS
jgi:kinesin family protein 2/24